MKQRIVLFAIIAAIALLSSAIMVNAPTDPYWLDTSWHFRINITINNTDNPRDFWPIELPINFTHLVYQNGKNGTFDSASIRVVETNSSGGILRNMTYQFENDSGFDAASNAAGTLIFVLNGTTAANETRRFQTYFDILENGAKSPVSFTTDLNYSWDGEEAEVNNSIKFRWRIDTLMDENLSGIYDVHAWDGGADNVITNSTGMPIEYVQYSNGTDNFSFDFRNNATFIAGPLRLVIEQTGNETFWNNPNAKTGFGLMKKRYVFYDDVKWMKIEQNFTNTGASKITRNSTNGGALSINNLNYNNLNNVVGDESNPLSRYSASAGGSGVGIINLNYTGNSTYYASGDYGIDRIGITLNTTNISTGSSITETAVLQFDDISYSDPLNLLPLRNQFFYPPIITVSDAQYIPTKIVSMTNYTTYNRNESVFIYGNVNSDPYNIISSMNATIDMGTAETSDDIILELTNIGSGLYSNKLNLSNNSTLGVWNITIKAYDSKNVLLNQSYRLFNMTNTYNVTLNITNPDGFVSRTVNATITVMNYRRDTYIGGALLNCSYGAEDLTNITDYNNGTYVLNFTAPATTGTYTLNCSASKFNNTGIDSQPFYTETSETEMSLNMSPENYTTNNISQSFGNDFIMSANATDMGGANAKVVNISLSLPQNISANATNQSCGTVIMASSCFKEFNITIANGTAPGNYTINASVMWENPDYSKNTTNSSFTIYVLSNPQINATPENISGTVPDGGSALIGNFKVLSIGNYNITNVTFNVSGLPDFTASFNPANITTLAAGASKNISVNISVPSDYSPGNYSGTINISAENGGWIVVGINVTIPEATTLSISRAPQNYTARNISLSAGEWFNITVNITNTGITNAKDANITLSMPNNMSANSTFESCGKIDNGASCIKAFNISISDKTPPGNYTFNITSTWRNPDSTINSTMSNFTVNVSSNQILNASTDAISVLLSDNSSAIAGNFTAYSIGNDLLTNITFNVTGLSNMTIRFVPSNISSLAMNASQSIEVNVSVPFAYSPGNYSGTINVSSRTGGWKTIPLNVNVSMRREWSRSPESCARAETPDTGTVCFVTISNTGNTPLNFTISPYAVNYTSVNQTSITIPKNSNSLITFLYNVSNTTKDFYYAEYRINATDSDTSPAYQKFNITLVPYVMPLFSLNITPNDTYQKRNIGIYANITDRSTTGINWTALNITLPNGTVETYNMSLLKITGSSSLWYFNYSGNMSAFIGYSTNISNYTGSTLQRGIYNITIASQDNTGVVGEATESFKIYAKLLIGLFPDATKYYQGQIGSIYYTLTEADGIGLENANITIKITDPQGNLTDSFAVSTDSNGQILPLSQTQFQLTSGSRVGTYNITANLSYYDAPAKKTLTSINNASFDVNAGSTGGGGGLKSNVRTAVVWYPDNVMNFEMWFTYAGNVTTPDNMSLKVYDPANNLYLSITLNDVNQTSPGIYRYQYAMPVNTASGYYRAELRASKEGFEDPDIEPFRVAKGGPYDVKLTVLPPLEVPRQDYLNFEILLENMGEVTQDVYVDYWTSYDNETYYYSGEAVLTPVGVNKTIVRTAYIFSNQPLGMNTLNVKVTYDNVQAPILLNAAFEVIDEDVNIPPPPQENNTQPPVSGGGGGDKIIERIVYLPPKEPLKPKTEKFTTGSAIEIESYEKDINIVRGWTALKSVTVKNSGGAPLTNVTLSLAGIPSSWFKITPDVYDSLPQGNNTVFLIEFKIPNNVDPGTYGLTYTASSPERLTEKVGRLIIFTSIEDLIKQELMTLKIDIEKLEEDTDYSERLGKDVSEVRNIISSARAQIKLAEDNVNKKSFDDALLNTQTASGLIKRGKRLLESLGAEVSEGSQKPTQSAWLFGLEALLIIVIIAAIALWMVRSRGKFKWNTIKAYLKRSEKKEDNEERKKELASEKEKIMRMTKLLENELKEGIITQNAYNELRKRNDDKMAKLERELKNS